MQYPKCIIPLINITIVVCIPYHQKKCLININLWLQTRKRLLPTSKKSCLETIGQMVCVYNMVEEQNDIVHKKKSHISLAS